MMVDKQKLLDIITNMEAELNILKTSLSEMTKPTSAPATQPAAPTPPKKYGGTADDLLLEFEEELASLIKTEQKPGYIEVKPIQFLGSENFAKIASVVRGLNGDYISAGRDSHFRVYT